MQNENLIQRNTQLIREIQTLQMQHQVIQNDLQLTIQSLEQSLSKEREFKTIAEEDCLQKNNVKKYLYIFTYSTVMFF